jgi:ACS family tartrate transporter-like MFS transporter
MDSLTAEESSVDSSTLARETFRRVFWKLVPLLGVLYLFNILDRANVGFARLRMQDDLNLSERAFNIGYGIFYLGYLLFEVPSNLLMRRVGARRWIARILISWGVISMATMFARDQWSFYTLRILLGIAESGFFPGIILYLSYWFPDAQRGRAIAFFMVSNAVSSILGNPASGLIMYYLDDTLGLHGWQWLFVLEGLPSVLLGFVVLRTLTDQPDQATWLAPEQRDWLVTRMQKEESQRQSTHGVARWVAVLQGRVWLLIAVYFSVAVGSNAAAAYFPRIIGQQFQGLNTAGKGLDTARIGLLAALPHVCAVIGMTFFGISSDRHQERRGHVAAAAILASCGWGLAAWNASPLSVHAGLCLAQLGMMSMLPVFWTLPTIFLSGAAAAAGIALINSVANLGGLVGPTILGEFGPWSMVITLAAGAVLVLLVRAEAPGRGRVKESGQ